VRVYGPAQGVSGMLSAQSSKSLQSAGPGWGTTLTLCMFGRVAAARGDHSTARKRLEESLELSRTLGISRGVVWALYFLAQHALAQGDARRARTKFPESLRLARQTGDHLATAFLHRGTRGCAVERHLRHIFAKLQIESRSGATRVAVQAGMA
jgi:ATP/maltotriose-dependent transcriptional regulator MalT